MLKSKAGAGSFVLGFAGLGFEVSGVFFLFKGFFCIGIGMFLFFFHVFLGRSSFWGFFWGKAAGLWLCTSREVARGRSDLRCV